MNPMLMMAQMMLETQKKLKEAQEKMMKVQVRHGPRVLGSACFSDLQCFTSESWAYSVSENSEKP